MPVLTLRQRILMLNAGMLCLALLLTSVMFYRNMSELQHTFVVSHGVTATQQLASLSGLSLADSKQPREALEALAGAVLEERGVRSLQIAIDQPELTVIRGPRMLTVREEMKLRDLGDIVVSRTEESYRFVGRIVAASDQNSEEILGWVELEYSLHPITSRLFTIFLNTGMAVSGLLLLVIVWGVMIGNRYTKKLESFSETASKIIHEDQDTPLLFAVDHQGDELDRLGAELNKAWRHQHEEHSNALRSAERQISEIQETLEGMELANVELHIAKRKAEEATRAKSEFLANASHEIRTPLNGIMGFAGLLQKSSLDNKQRDYSQTIEQSATGLLHTINQVLDYSRIEAHKMPLEPVELNLFDLLEDSLYLMAGKATEKGLTIDLVYEYDVPEIVHADPHRLFGVANNLIANAIKFTEAGGITVRVTLKTVEQLRVEIIDTGIGIPEEKLDQLFHAFTQVDPSVSRQFGGTGLGLAISQGTMREMGSKIDVESTLGAGSRFSFALELAGKQATPEPPVFGLGKTVGLSISEPGLRESVEHLLRRWDIRFISDGDLSRADATLTMVNSETIDQAHHISRLQVMAEQQTLVVFCPAHLIARAQTQFGAQGTKVLQSPYRRGFLLDALSSTGESLAISTEDEPDTASSTAPSTAGGIAAGEVLIVDDNRANLKLLKELLSQEGLSSALAADGYQALELCQQRRFDLIMMDIQMPGLSGTEASKAIRQSGLNAETPIVAVTAHVDARDRDQFIQAGMNDYLAKPILENALRDVLQKWSRLWRPGISDVVENLSDETLDTPVDIALSLRLAGGRAELAAELLEGLLLGLTDEKMTMRLLHMKRDKALGEHIHKLHGLACYVGVPRLKALCKTAEDEIKSVGTLSQESFDALEREIDRLCEWHEQYDVSALFG